MRGELRSRVLHRLRQPRAGDDRLLSGHGVAHAEVLPHAEAEVAVLPVRVAAGAQLAPHVQVLAQHVVRVRILEHALVPVPRPQHERDHRPLGDHLAVDLDLARGVPRLAVDHRVVAHHLREHVRPEAGVALHLVLELVRARVQHVVPHDRDGLVRRVAARRQQQRDESLDLVDVHALPAELRVHDA